MQEKNYNSSGDAGHRSRTSLVPDSFLTSQEETKQTETKRTPQNPGQSPAATSHSQSNFV